MIENGQLPLDARRGIETGTDSCPWTPVEESRPPERTAEEAPAGWGCALLTLHHDKEDERLRRFYRRCGYRPSGEPETTAGGFLLVHLAKPLSAAGEAERPRYARIM